MREIHNIVTKKRKSHIDISFSVSVDFTIKLEKAARFRDVTWNDGLWNRLVAMMTNVNIYKVKVSDCNNLDVLDMPSHSKSHFFHFGLNQHISLVTFTNITEGEIIGKFVKYHVWEGLLKLFILNVCVFSAFLMID